MMTLRMVLYLLISTGHASPDAPLPGVYDSGTRSFVGYRSDHHAGILWTEEAFVVHADERLGPSAPVSSFIVREYLTFEPPATWGSLDTCRRAAVVQRYGHAILRTTHHRDAAGECVETPWLFDTPITIPPPEEGWEDHGPLEVRRACAAVFGTECDVRFTGRLDLTGVHTLGSLCARLDELPRPPGVGIGCSVQQFAHGPMVLIYESHPRPPMPTPERLAEIQAHAAAIEEISRQMELKEITPQEAGQMLIILAGGDPPFGPQPPPEPMQLDAEVH